MSTGIFQRFAAVSEEMLRVFRMVPPFPMGPRDLYQVSGTCRAGVRRPHASSMVRNMDEHQTSGAGRTMATTLTPDYDSGNLHPNDAGLVAMGESIPLRPFARLIAAADAAGVTAAAAA